MYLENMTLSEFFPVPEPLYRQQNDQVGQDYL